MTTKILEQLRNIAVNLTKVVIKMSQDRAVTRIALSRTHTADTDATQLSS